VKSSTLIVLLFVFCACSLHSKPIIPTVKSGFVENKGQIVTQNEQCNTEVLYLLKLSGFQVQIRKGGFSYEFIQKHYAEKSAGYARAMSNGKKMAKPSLLKRTIKRIDVNFIGMSKNCKVQALDTEEVIFNFKNQHTPELGINGVRSYRKLRFCDFYEGIDLIYNISETGEFKYDFAIKHGYNATKIKWVYAGTDSVKFTPSSLRLFAADEALEEIIPRSYILETEQDVAVEFRQIEDGFFGYKVPVKTNGTLNIDPFVRRVWSTYFGENTEEVLVIEPAGGCNSYLLGTATTDMLGTTGVYRDTLINPTGDYAWDVCLAKMNSTGSAFLWFTYFGGKEDDLPNDMVLAQNGDIVIGGTTSSNADVASSGAYRTTYDGPCEGFIARFNNLGQLLWSTYIGGDSFDYVYAVQMDKFDNIFFLGITASANIGKGTVYRTTLGGEMDIILGKLTGDGTNLVWLTYYGGEQDEDGGLRGLVLRDSFLYAVAHTLSTSGIATTGSFQTSHSGNYDVCLVKFDTTGKLKWGTYFGGSDGDYSHNMSMDANRNLYLAGTTESSNFPVGGFIHQSAYAGNFDGFVSSFTHSGSLRWSTYYGGSGSEYICGSKVNECGDFALTGYTTSTSGIASTGSFDTVGNGGSLFDGLLAQFDDTGAFVAGTYYGATDYTMSYAVNYDLCGRIITGGSSYATGLATSGTYQTTNVSTAAIIFAFDSTADCPLVALSAGFIYAKADRVGRQRAAISWKYDGDMEEPAEFVVYRQDPMQFIPVGKIKAVKGISEYRFADLLPAPSIGYDYRIRYKGRQGQTAWSKVFSLSGVESQNISVFPNPADEEIFVEWPPDYEQIELFITDMVGKKLKSGVLSKASPNLRLSDLPPGFYVLNVVAGDELKVVKFCIRRQ